MPFVLPFLLFGAGTGTGIWLSGGFNFLKWLLIAAVSVFLAVKLGVFS